jgi:methylase of polypeptide subunit release factors
LPPDLKHEPKKALFAADEELAIVKKLIETTPTHLSKNGILIIELDPCQHKEIIEFAKSYGLKKVQAKDYVVVLKNLDSGSSPE